MSTDAEDAEDLDLSAAGVPELTALGKRIELLRMERRLNKRVLAQRAGTSRQQLWRVMTGKSELTSSLCARLAEVLEIDSRWLRNANRDDAAETGELAFHPSGNGNGGPDADASAGELAIRRHAASHSASRRTSAPHGAASGGSRAGRTAELPSLCETLEDYIAPSGGLERAIDAMPVNDDGRRLKRALLNAVEEAAEARRTRLPASFFELRRQIVNGER